MRKRTIIIFSLAVVCCAIALLSLRNNIFSPYVSLKEAIENPGNYVQVIGSLDKSTISRESDGFSFNLTDSKNTKVKVYKSGIKPANFEHAEQVVLIGKYISEDSMFVADKVLTKCPSRYVKSR